MKLTDNPCRNCKKRSADCRLSCARYKVYHTAKLREYEKRKKDFQAEADMAAHISDAISKRRRHTVRYTPPKNGGTKT